MKCLFGIFTYFTVIALTNSQSQRLLPYLRGLSRSPGRRIHISRTLNVNDADHVNIVPSTQTSSAAGGFPSVGLGGVRGAGGLLGRTIGRRSNQLRVLGLSRAGAGLRQPTALRQPQRTRRGQTQVMASYPSIVPSGLGGISGSYPGMGRTPIFMDMPDAPDPIDPFDTPDVVYIPSNALRGGVGIPQGTMMQRQYASDRGVIMI